MSTQCATCNNAPRLKHKTLCRDCLNVKRRSQYKTPINKWTSTTDIPRDGTKKCSKCEEVKPKTEFCLNRKRTDGVDSCCSRCKYECEKERKTINSVINKTRGIDTTGDKTCCTCKITKPKLDFFKDCNQKDGLTPNCKVCHGIISAKVRQRNTEHWTKNSIDIVGDKTCSLCKITKPKTEFYTDKSMLDGLRGWCSNCTDDKTMDRQNRYRDHWMIHAVDTLGTKICAYCKEEKQKTEFPINHGTASGLFSYCKTCSTEERRQRRAKNRKIINQWKMENGPCACGENNVLVLEFDHKIWSQKEDNISDMIYWNADSLIEELQKTIVRCRFCHQVETSKQRHTHGLICSNERILKCQDYNKQQKLKVGKCLHCERKVDPNDEHNFSGFDWDHMVHSEKIDTVSNIVKGGNIQRIQEEIDKCQLLCANCHLLKTYRERGLFDELNEIE